MRREKRKVSTRRSSKSLATISQGIANGSSCRRIYKIAREKGAGEGPVAKGDMYFYSCTRYPTKLILFFFNSETFGLRLYGGTVYGRFCHWTREREVTRLELLFISIRRPRLSNEHVYGLAAAV